MEYRLSASLRGHEDDVRAVSFPAPSAVISTSRDETIRTWKRTSETPPTYECSLLRLPTASGNNLSDFVNSVTYVGPSKIYPEGLVVTGSQHAIIEARRPSQSPHDNAEARLSGHHSNVCALDTTEDGQFIVSGSWDHTARVWEVGRWDQSRLLQGHKANVWSVLAYDNETIITGCADKRIRIFHVHGKLMKQFDGGEDVVRALCRLPLDHSSGAQFASAGNDNIIRLWTLDGTQVAELHGHKAFVYSLAALPQGQIASSSEDGTVRIWEGIECIQTISHPATTVWCVAACQDNGDIVTGASDKVVRIFSKSEDRQNPEATEDFTKAVSAHAALLQDQNTAAVSTQSTTKPTTKPKELFEGKYYDMVIPVMMEDETEVKYNIPLNYQDNPYKVAETFIQKHELPAEFLNQIVQHILANTPEIPNTTEEPKSPPGPEFLDKNSGTRNNQVQQILESDGSVSVHQWSADTKEWVHIGTAIDAPESGAKEVAETGTGVSTIPKKLLPRTQYISMDRPLNPKLESKIIEFNSQLDQSGSESLSVDASLVSATIKVLSGSADRSENLQPASIDLIIHLCTRWPNEKRVPGLDLLRMAAVRSAKLATHSSSGSATIIDALSSAGVFAVDSPKNNVLVAVRVLVNLFNTEEGRTLAYESFFQVQSLLSSHLQLVGTDYNVAAALTALYCNHAVSILKQADLERALAVLEVLSDVLPLMLPKLKEHDEYCGAFNRGIEGVGTILALDSDELRSVAREALGFKDLLRKAEGIKKSGGLSAAFAKKLEALSAEVASLL